MVKDVLQINCFREVPIPSLLSSMLYWENRQFLKKLIGDFPKPANVLLKIVNYLVQVQP